MAENKKNKVFNKENLFTGLLGASSLSDWLKTEGGKKVVEKISGKIFGIGPNDEALMEIAFSFYIEKILKLDISDPVNEVKIKQEKVRFNEFLVYLKENGFSTWWFRNVLAAMSPGDKEEENKAATKIAEIMMEKTFPEMIEIAGPNLIQKTYVKKASEGWEVVTGKNGRMSLLVNYSKLKNKSSGMIEKAQDDFKSGFWSGLKIAGIIGIVFVVLVAVVFSLL